MVDTSLDSRRHDRLKSAFRQEEHDALRLVVLVRSIALALIAVWAVFTEIPQGLPYILGMLAVFALLGVAQLIMLWPFAANLPWLKYGFALVDICLLCAIVLAPNPLHDFDIPTPMMFRFDNFIYFFVLMMSTVMTYSPRLVLWFGAMTGLAWGVGLVVILGLPGSLTWADLPQDPPPTLAQEIAHYMDPHFVDITGRLNEILVMGIVAGFLAVAAHRARRVVQRQVRSERERGNLARYFSPNLVDELARSDEPLNTVRNQPVAVLFADIVGFTRMSEAMTPEASIALLREFHSRMTRLVFDHHGTLDKYIGDAVMATFGTPHSRPEDASNALRCALAMFDELAAWNRQRRARGQAPVRIGLGLHYGPAVLGDIGSERRLEYTVIGDTVNVASRLEQLTRSLGSDMVISDDLAAKVRDEGFGDLVAGFAAAQAQQLRNRDQPVGIRTWRANAVTA